MDWNVFYIGNTIGAFVLFVIVMIVISTREKKSIEEEKERFRRENRQTEVYDASGIGDYYYVLNGIAAELVNYRVKNEITTQKLAEDIGVSPEYIAQIEREELDLTLKELVDLVHKLRGEIKVSIRI